MSAFLSPLWYRVAGLKPALRSPVRVHRQRYRERIWRQLTDGASGRRHRLNEAAWAFVGRFDGRATADEAWNAVVAAEGERALSQEEAIGLLGRLNAAGLLRCELTPDIEALFRQHREERRRRRWADLNPLAVRVRLFDPSGYLDRCERLLPLVFNGRAFLAWLVLTLPALWLAAARWPELSAFAAAHAGGPRYLLIAWLAYPAIKILHELGHALAVRRFGGTVNDCGITLFVLLPVPYVDASAATDFTSRARRAIVSAMGIAVELAIAAAAFYVWLAVEPGWVRDIAFVTMLIAGLASIAVNGNPLLRFDGYHLLCDLAELPNLDARSRGWWVNWVERRVLRMDVPPPPLAAGERKWLALYMPLAWTYRAWLAALIVLWAAAQSPALGLALAVSIGLMIFVLPLRSLVRHWNRALEGRARRRALGLGGAALAAAITATCVFPAPYHVVAPAIVWLPEQAQVRAETAGFVKSVESRDGEAVAPGRVLAVLDDPELRAEQEAAHARLSSLQVQQASALRSDRQQAQSLVQAVEQAEAEADRLDERVGQLEIRGQLDGRLVIARADDLPDTFLRKGQLLGYVLAPGDTVVRAVLPHEIATLVASRTRGAEVWLAERNGTTIAARLERVVPAASRQLPSAALSDRNGGAVATDPADTEHLRTLQPVFTVDVTMPPDALSRVGGRAYVRFDLGREVLVLRWGRALGQLLLSHVDDAAPAPTAAPAKGERR